mmetsp:Transcript_3599/g.7868  ORF Transcript_3599/g.7868 Transcript_3599/m.7868 type:complete len:217 (-) Transcript_3599:260-910(-)
MPGSRPARTSATASICCTLLPSCTRTPAAATMAIPTTRKKTPTPKQPPPRSDPTFSREGSLSGKNRATSTGSIPPSSPTSSRTRPCRGKSWVFCKPSSRAWSGRGAFPRSPTPGAWSSRTGPPWICPLRRWPTPSSSIARRGPFTAPRATRRPHRSSRNTGSSFRTSTGRPAFASSDRCWENSRARAGCRTKSATRCARPPGFLPPLPPKKCRAAT